MVRRNCRSFGVSRDALIVRLVHDLGALVREQIQALAFQLTDYGTWKARRRLAVLVQRGELKRGRCGVSDSYAYWVGRRPVQLDHLIMTNWAYVVLQPEHWEREYACGEHLIADAYAVAKGQPYLIEAHRSVNHSRFANKVEQYNAYFESEQWNDEDWPTPDRFAVVLVITDDKRVKQAIQKHNRLGLRFWVLDLQELGTWRGLYEARSAHGEQRCQGSG